MFGSGGRKVAKRKSKRRKKKGEAITPTCADRWLKKTEGVRNKALATRAKKSGMGPSPKKKCMAEELIGVRKIKQGNRPKARAKN